MNDGAGEEEIFDPGRGSSNSPKGPDWTKMLPGLRRPGAGIPGALSPNVSLSFSALLGSVPLSRGAHSQSLQSREVCASQFSPAPMELPYVP